MTLEEKSTNKNKMRTFRLFKTAFGFEKHLLQIKNPVGRRLVTKFRILDYNIYIELGRWCTPKIPVHDERIFKFCQIMR